jgi:DNA-binding IclR family transcriptional regulator
MASISGASKPPLPTNSLERALAMMETLLSHPRGLTHSELCRLLAMPSSTCTYITSKLEFHGYLCRDSNSGRFRLGLKTVPLAHGALHGLGFRSIAEPVLYRLTLDTGLSAGIGVLQGGKVLVVDRVDGPDVVEDVVRHAKPRGRARENRDVGRELPLHSTALGKVLVAFQDEPGRSALLERLNLDRSTPSTILNRSDLAHQLPLIRKQGYAIADEEQYTAVRALAVPVFDRSRRAAAALSLNGQAAASAWNDLPSLLGLVQAAAQEISRRSREPWAPS